MSVHWPIIRHLVTHPTRVAVVDDKRSYRGIDLLGASAHVSRAIKSESRARHIGLMLPTSGAFPIAALAAWGSGRVIVPLNYLLKPAELQYVVDDSEIDAIVTVQPMLDFIGETPKGVKIIKLDELSFKGLPPVSLPKKAAGDDLAALVYTSGTSGKPKGVMLSHGALKKNAEQGCQGLGLSAGDKMLGVLPQFHCYGMTQLTLTPLMHGVPVVYTARFSPKKLMDLVKTHQATCLVGIPSMFNAIASLKSAGPEDVESLRLIVSGSEALPDAVFEKFHAKYGKPITEGYGMTEMAPATHCNLPENIRRHSVGRPLPGVEQRIVDPANEGVLGVDTDGEIRLRGPNAMSGYWKLDDATREVFDGEGYYRTGDMGRIDAEGYLSITGRIKEMMIIGGENVFPVEIESVLNEHPSVSACGVTSVSDDTRGEAPIAFVELEEGETAEPRELQAYCREHLAGCKVPKAVYVVEALPRNATGKIMRKELKGMLPAEAAAG
ncbi:MAG: hypothetical protein CMJ31_14225 [Phycisphaerae bacterium]|nr:hypothetical protein [Phycisphaerae bacterium]